ncbi:FAD-binding protein [Streptomyces sp. NPDC048718]|uniref:FAD-dependent oxidoreductase n=1 Tax=Streptomyces sp. NPDC048718 TaxID=3365587 RepID=UPI00371A08A0
MAAETAVAPAPTPTPASAPVAPVPVPVPLVDGTPDGAPGSSTDDPPAGLPGAGTDVDADFEILTGRGRTAPSLAYVLRPRTYEETAAAVLSYGHGTRGAIARGLGRAHGDAAQNAGGTVLDLTRLARIRAVDAVAGVVVCDAGTGLYRLARAVLPLGWCVPVAPATRHATVGGAVAADVHGANHPGSGSFSRHVVSLDLLTADGQTHTVVPGMPLFDATTGGLGLTGVILSVTLRLLPVETALVTVATERAGGFDDLLARFTDPDPGHRHRYTAARVDLLARGAATGRAVLTRADHTPREALPARARRTPLAAPWSGPDGLPGLPGLPGWSVAALIDDLRARAMSADAGATGRFRSLASFLHPRDGFPHGGRGGFVRYEFAVGHGHEETLRRVVGRIAARGCARSPGVLKRFGETGPGLLSFPLPGWTLAVDLPASHDGLGGFLDTLDEEIAAAGGRVRLAEDARLRPDLVESMYPGLGAFRELRAALDPGAVFVSDLARRLGL